MQCANHSRCLPAAHLVDGRQVAVRQRNRTAHPLDGLAHERRHPSGRGCSDEIGHVFSVARAVVAEGAAVGIRVQRVVHAEALRDEVGGGGGVRGG